MNGRRLETLSIEFIQLARRVLAREVDPLLAVHDLDALATEMGIGLDSPFIGIKRIASQCDHLPSPSIHMTPEYAKRVALDRAELAALFQDDLRRHCEEAVKVLSVQSAGRNTGS